MQSKIEKNQKLVLAYLYKYFSQSYEKISQIFLGKILTRIIKFGLEINKKIYLEITILIFVKILKN